MEILPAAFRQHHLSAALQHCGQLRRGQVHRRKRAGRRRQQLRDHADLHRVRLRLQHRLLGHRLPALRREEAGRNENGGLYDVHLKRGRLRGADARGHAGLRRSAAAHQHAGKRVRGFQALSGYLHPRSAVRVLLQRGDGHFLRTGRFQNAVYLPGRVLDEQHLHGYPVRHRA